MYGKKWSDVEKNALNYLAIGEKHVYLDGNSDDIPWELAEGFASGGTHRMDICVSGRFHATHRSGLIVNWSFDLESREANGSGKYMIDRQGILLVLSKIKGDARTQFLAYLDSVSSAVQKRGEEYLSVAQSQFGDAQLLRSLVSGAQ